MNLHLFPTWGMLLDDEPEANNGFIRKTQEER